MRFGTYFAGEAQLVSGTRDFVEIDRVSLVYRTKDGDTLALKDADIRIAKGEFVSVVGPSGCGKSTLLKLVSGLHAATTGNVIVGGEEVTGPLKICGMAFQNSIMLPWRTLMDNVLLPMEIVEPHARTFRRDRNKHVAAAKELLATVGLSGFEDKYPWQLSGGMQQRGSLCRALIHSPELLLLDEPFAALDAFTREELWDVVQTLWIKKRPTVILITHDLREAVYLSDRVIMMSARPGRVLSTNEIGFARPRTPDVAFQPDFVDIVHHLRDEISAVRARK
ncbi:MAG: ATP-binding cassette domain-containing protein [Alphaproteobacteria bacterium]|nr:ATP-binding cassette domain-containing protein [Alphaproteobacteria bacterium]